MIVMVCALYVEGHLVCVVMWAFFFFKQKTAYEMRISDWISEVCSSDLIVQSNLLAELESLVICPITSAVRDAAFRITVEPDNANGLRVLSQVMVDKLSTLPRSKISKPFGRLDDERMKAVDRALLLVVGLI